jgi:E-phenylitaconyl-CoA hydratase
MDGPVRVGITKGEQQMAVLFEVDEKIATLTLNRPEVLNAMDPATYSEISAAFMEIEKNDHIRVGIVTGAGLKAFTAGADLKLMHTGSPDDNEWTPWRPTRWDFGLSTSKPLVAAVNGYALAGGLELALICDIRIASPNAMFGTPEVKWNLLDGYGAFKLPRIVGLSMAMEMLLTGDFIDAEEALRVGLISHIYPHHQLMSEARRLAERIRDNGPMAVRMTKELVERGQTNSLEDHFRIMHEYYGRVDRTSDQREGLTAFAKKRRPVY